ncbi:hypothetical protein VQ03_21230 [Methylobacterium tarhaniae]|uniref:Uncharacterized protein n=1 Tax=Methylobacterium tarhaniae TaxID=1187852 RepID=A0A0J6SR38_9HYPH|nr:hypothetical protein [Methylobacterium tarhaniae]KMO36042.1 hypothetical protein VQ03_21230 [Methylobacterium tarhaniae]
MLLLGALIVWTPFLLLVLSLVVARLTGCEVNEARANPCPIAGIDIGPLLYRMMVMGWFVLPLLPFMALTLIGGAVAGLVALVRIWRP